MTSSDIPIPDPTNPQPSASGPNPGASQNTGASQNAGANAAPGASNAPRFTGGPTAGPGNSGTGNTGTGNLGTGSYEDLLRVALELGRNPDALPIIDSIASSLLLTIGSGPSFATMQSMLAAQQANSQMFANSVASQQRTNILGMVATMECVKSMMNPNAWPSAAIAGALGEEGAS